MKIESLSMNPAKFFKKNIKSFKVGEEVICVLALLCGKTQKYFIELKFRLYLEVYL